MTKGEVTRQFILEKSASIFNTKGIEGTSMSDVMHATKLSKGIHYVHFKDKEDLASCAVDYCFDQLEKKTQAAISRCKTGKEKLSAYIKLLSNPNNPPVEGGCPILNFGMEADDTNELIRIKVKNQIESGQKLIEVIINEGIKNKEFNPDWKASEFATIMFAMIEGGQLICRVSANDYAMKAIIKTLKNTIEQNSI